MACGTPVLTTPVAAIPDVVQDEITGFFLEDTSAECIASGILRVLSYEDIENVIERAHAMIADKFSFDNAIKRWRCILYGE
jgi:glycosyltransferase involved in cell wall biosynthesis